MISHTTCPACHGLITCTNGQHINVVVGNDMVRGCYYCITKEELWDARYQCMHCVAGGRPNAVGTTYVYYTRRDRFGTRALARIIANPAAGLGPNRPAVVSTPVGNLDPDPNGWRELARAMEDLEVDGPVPVGGGRVVPRNPNRLAQAFGALDPVGGIRFDPAPQERPPAAPPNRRADGTLPCMCNNCA